MEGITADIQELHFLLTDLAPFFIPSVIEPRLKGEAGFRFRVPDQVDDGDAVQQGAPTPIFRNEAEQALLELVPLAGARQKVRDVDGEVEIIRQPWEFRFPQPDPAAVTAAPIGGDIQLRRLLV
jgi:hypothetical protein